MRAQGQRYLRQMDICPPEKLQFPITVIGAGAVGSMSVLALASMGCGNVTVWDDDRVEPHNVATQLYGPGAIGQSKAMALRWAVRSLTGTDIRPRAFRYVDQDLEGVVVTSVDNMATRLAVWEGVKLSPRVPLLVDPRLGGEFGRLYAVSPSDPEQAGFYEANLYGSQEAEPAACSSRSIFYGPLLFAGLVAHQVKRFALGQPLVREALLDIPSLRLVTDGGCRVCCATAATVQAAL